MEGLLGRKLGMTQIFDEAGEVVPVTVLEVGPCVVTQILTAERHGYHAVQLGFGHKKRLKEPERGHLKASGAQSRYLREMKTDGTEDYTVGQTLDAGVFQPGEVIDVTGTSKGKGFAGVIKRHHFRGGPKTHGQSDRWRAPGSIGATTTPGRVFKGQRMAGHMGHERVTVQNLRVVRVDAERNLLLVRGSVPGPNEGLLLVRKAIKARQRAAAAQAKR
ncbi:MAG TPA: 50S ribosomal protein L3 [Thermomicrobiales bacterium]|nr:50S ribosomal protein L3 [Thermomicrobiales bacterium]